MKAFKKIISVLLIAMLAFGCLTVAYAETLEEKESNNTSADATLFTVTSSIKGRLDDTEDVDWYKVDLGTSIGIATFSFKHAGDGSDSVYFNVAIYAEEDTDTAVKSFSVKGNVKETKSGEVLIPGGNYLVKVSNGNVNDSREYQISVKLDSNLLTESGNNDDKSNADEITTTPGYVSKPVYASVTYDGDVDFFKFATTTGFFRIGFGALTPNVNYNINIYMIPGDSYKLELIGQYTVKAEDCKVSSDNAEGYSWSANIGVRQGTYFAEVTADNKQGNANAYGGDALYKIAVGVVTNNNSEEEFNYNRTYANGLELANGKKIVGSISFADDIDYYRFVVKSDKKEYKITISGDDKSNSDTASWYVSVYKVSNSKEVVLDDYKALIADMRNPVEIDVNGLNPDTYYIVVSRCSSSKGDYTVKVEDYKSEAKPAQDGNFFQRVWARIKEMGWQAFWQENFKPLLDAIGGPEGALKTIASILKLSIGSIVKILGNNNNT